MPILEELKDCPRMTSWFDPGLLLKLILRVILSDVFGQYADRRLIVAALDKDSDDEIIRRTNLGLTAGPDGALWIDYVADVGDGFDSTYAVASLLAQRELHFADLKLPRGETLFMGGDEVYPHAFQKYYEERLFKPYALAFPRDKSAGAVRPRVFLIPGNHDWYDGLDLFLAYFCRSRFTSLGNWRAKQPRSYFALKLTDKWWLWGIDNQLADALDEPQTDYFRLIAKNMPTGSKIILCGAEPGWLYTKRKDNKAFEILDYVGWIALNADKGHAVPLVLSGDTHHYSRYSANDPLKTQFITSGGGGAFLHPTHSLKNLVDAEWLGARVELKLNTSPAADHSEVETSACYPSRQRSEQLLIGDWKFPWSNPQFSFTLGAF